MKVWIDLANSPHPPLFAPIARALEEDGHTIVLTARDNAQTVELARARWKHVDLIGGETPQEPARKARAIVGRMLDLRIWAKEAQPQVALSHNSYAQIAAARALRIPAVTAMDYEHQPSNHLAFRLASTILLPEALPRAAVARQGATRAKTRFYPGLKEEITLEGFEPETDILEQVGVMREPGIAVVITRPPPSRAIYHRHGNDLYLEALLVLGEQSHLRVVALPRHVEQRRLLEGLGIDNLLIPERAVDARSLMYAADLVIGAGGTMTREAAVLGAPTFTAFGGRPAAVDAWLEARGALRRLLSPRDVADVRPRTTPPPVVEELRSRAQAGISAFTKAVEESQHSG
jgi:predicted glycosyltransferase